VPSTLVDAGPLIALLDRSDRHHGWAKERFEAHEGALLTTWPVLAEVCHFLPEPVKVRFLHWAADGGLDVHEVDPEALHELAGWMEKYVDLPMDLADASLLWVARQSAVFDILTLDLRDFSVYRLEGGKALRPVR
jgi:predicted nucleic acid-binding protein